MLLPLPAIVVSYSCYFLALIMCGCKINKVGLHLIDELRCTVMCVINNNVLQASAKLQIAQYLQQDYTTIC